MWMWRHLQNDTFPSQTVSQYGWKHTCRVLKALLSKEHRCSNKEEREEDGVGNDAVISNRTWSVQKMHWHSVQNLKMNCSLFRVMINHTFYSVKYKRNIVFKKSFKKHQKRSIRLVRYIPNVPWVFESHLYVQSHQKCLIKT